MCRFVLTIKKYEMILITGASRGIGKFLFDRFVESGEAVAGTFHSTKPEEGNSDLYTKVDICNSANITNWINDIGDKLENITLINCAGNNYNAFAHKSSPEAWSSVIQTNLIGTYNCIRVILPIMREQNFGRIINLASIVAQVGIPGTSAYAASKAGLWGLTKSIAVENANKGITANCLNLGYFDIGMIHEVPEKFQEVIKGQIPSGEFGQPENIYNAVRFLMDTEYINGTNLDINGAKY